MTSRRILGIHASVSWKDWQYFITNNSYASWSTHPDNPFKTFDDVIAYAKANSGKLRVGTDGQGGLWHEAMLLISTRAGFTFSNIPFEGGAPATLAAIQKEVDITGSGLHEQAQFIRAGKLRNLAVFSKDPIDLGNGLVAEPITTFVPGAAPDAPFGGIVGVAARRDVPPDVLATINDTIRQAVASDSFQKMTKERLMKANFMTEREVDVFLARLEVRRAELFQQIGLAKKTAAELGLPKPDDFDAWWPPVGYTPAI